MGGDILPTHPLHTTGRREGMHTPDRITGSRTPPRPSRHLYRRYNTDRYIVAT